MVSLDPSSDGALVVTEVSAVPAEPPAHILYRHKARFLESVSQLWAHREIIYTLAERDFRAQYKQAALGAMWAVLSPVATLVIFVVVFSHAKQLVKLPTNLPYALYAFVGIMCWNYFAGSLGSGGSSLLTNKALLAKTQFPRECFPLETMLVQALNTLISFIPLTLLFVFFGRVPALASLWVPLFMVIEVAFAVGVTLTISSLIIQMRDLVQVLPIMISLGLFVNPVIWPFSSIPSAYRIAGGHRVTHLVTHNGHTATVHQIVGGLKINLQMVYGFFNPLGPIIDSARRTMLLGLNPQWGLIGVAALGALLYLSFGYKIFKRFEVNFADIA